MGENLDWRMAGGQKNLYSPWAKYASTTGSLSSGERLFWLNSLKTAELASLAAGFTCDAADIVA